MHGKCDAIRLPMPRKREHKTTRQWENMVPVQCAGRRQMGDNVSAVTMTHAEGEAPSQELFRYSTQRVRHVVRVILYNACQGERPWK